MTDSLLIFCGIDKILNCNFVFKQKSVSFMLSVWLIFFAWLRYPIQQRIQNDDAHTNQLPTTFQKTFSYLPQYLHKGIPAC